MNGEWGLISNFIEERISWPPDTCLTVEAVLSTAMMFYSATIDFFQQLSETAPTQSVGDIFRNLASVLLEKKKRAVRSANEVLIDI